VQKHSIIRKIEESSEEQLEQQGSSYLTGEGPRALNIQYELKRSDDIQVPGGVKELSSEQRLKELL
jgi:hypothetical protein